MAEGAIVPRGIRGVMMDGAGGVGCGVMTDQAAIGNLGAKAGVAIRASMATAAFRIGYEVGRQVAAMERGPIRMAIQATDSQIVILNNGLDVGISGLDIDRAGRVMTRGAGVEMEGKDAGCTTPGVGELLGRHTAKAMAGVTE